MESPIETWVVHQCAYCEKFFGEDELRNCSCGRKVCSKCWSCSDQCIICNNKMLEEMYGKEEEYENDRDL